MDETGDVEVNQSWTWIGSVHGLGGMTVTPPPPLKFEITAHICCYFFQIMSSEPLAILVFFTIKS